jgi:hypothetical protein
MGALGHTVFCARGHIVEDIPHHCLSETDASEIECPVHGLNVMPDDFSAICTCKKPAPCLCGETRFVDQVEWGDPDYGPHEVPMEPIDFDTVFGAEIDVVVQIGGGPVQMKGKPVLKIPRYDVSKLLNKS